MGWKGLEEVINQMVQAINNEVALEDARIEITDTNRDKFEVSKIVRGSTDAGEGLCSARAIQGQTDTLRWDGIKWHDLRVVDSATGEQSMILVLVRGIESPSGFGGDSITITTDDYTIWITRKPDQSSASA
jgi:hypothetical protein